MGSDDTVAHTVRSVCTPLRTDDPFATPSAHAIGGVLSVDLGLVGPGTSVTVTLPAAVPAGFGWTLLGVPIPPSSCPPRHF